jgi:hypothetical protein
MKDDTGNAARRPNGTATSTTPGTDDEPAMRSAQAFRAAGAAHRRRGHVVDPMYVRRHEIDAFRRLVPDLPHEILHRIRAELLRQPTLHTVRSPNATDAPLANDPTPARNVPRGKPLGLDASGAHASHDAAHDASHDASYGVWSLAHAITSTADGDAPPPTTMGRFAVSAEPHGETPSSAEEALAAPLVDATLAAQLRRADDAQLRQLILANATLLKPLFCLWPWWLYYTRQVAFFSRAFEAARTVS